MSLKRNISLYKLFSFSTGVSFQLPIFVLFLQSLGMSFTQIMIATAAMSAGQIAFEVPSGVFSDFYGRKKTLVIGAAFRILALGILSSANGFFQATAGYFMLGAMYAFYSGTDSSLLYDSLKSMGDEKNYKKIQGISRSFFLASFGITSFLGGFITSYWGLRAPFFASFLISPLTLISVLLMCEPPLTKKIDDRNYFRHLKESIQFTASHKEVRWLLAYWTASILLMLSSHRLLQPYLQGANIPLSYFGIIYAIWLAVSSLAARKADAIEKYLGGAKTLMLLPTLIVLGVLPLAFYSGWGGVLIYFLPEASYGLFVPIVSAYMHWHVSSHNRATVMSLGGFIRNVSFLIFGPIFGLLADYFSVSAALGVIGSLAVFVVIATGMRVGKSKSFGTA